jgi:hypothetical protein
MLVSIQMERTSLPVSGRHRDKAGFILSSPRLCLITLQETVSALLVAKPILQHFQSCLGRVSETACPAKPIQGLASNLSICIC